ncbi:unnamed protein product [Hymenolepis diminuta]|uniref:Cystatin domain-containing protein n=1 Tax=Hymenolepis diminuta TaxID=6216 RepID=A0A0R3SPY4_HYMDI|nr:unnamed protein product [Hymenolepis diminuta]
MKLYHCLVLFFITLSVAEPGRLGGIARIHRDRLQLPEVKEIIKIALEKIDPCAELSDVLCGTMQVVNGIKYRFRIRTTQKPNCDGGFQGPKISVIRIHLPADRTSEPSFKME